MVAPVLTRSSNVYGLPCRAWCRRLFDERDIGLQFEAWLARKCERQRSTCDSTTRDEDVQRLLRHDDKLIGI